MLRIRIARLLKRHGLLELAVRLAPISGGAGYGLPAPPAPAPPAPAPPAPAPAPAPAPPSGGPPAPAPTEPPGWDGEFDAPRARQLIEKQRAENKSLADQLKQVKDGQQTILKTIGQALGLEAGDPVDPVKALQDQLGQRDAKIRDLELGHTLSRVLTASGAHASMADYLKGSGALSDLDPTADGFERQLQAVVKKSLETNPHFKAVQGPPRSGGEFPGGSGGPQETITREMLKTMTPEAIVAARKAGKLVHLGIAPDQFGTP